MESLSTIPPGERADPAAAADKEQAHAVLAQNLETLLAAARPRLLSLAYLQGVPSEAAEDVVQETLLTAWRQLDTLRAPERFDAWLDGICRHRCQMQARSTRAALAHQIAPADRGETDT